MQNNHRPALGAKNGKAICHTRFNISIQAYCLQFVETVLTQNAVMIAFRDDKLCISGHCAINKLIRPTGTLCGTASKSRLKYQRQPRDSQQKSLPLHKSGCTRQSVGKPTLRSLAPTLHKSGCTRQSVGKPTLRSLAPTLHKSGCARQSVGKPTVRSLAPTLHKSGCARQAEAATTKKRNQWKTKATRNCNWRGIS